MTALYHLAHRFATEAATVERVRALCTPSDRHVWIGTRNAGQRALLHTFRGVPGANVDLLFPTVPFRASAGEHYSTRDGTDLGEWLIVCEIGQKLGRYDHRPRTRLTFRDWPPPPAGCPVPSARLFVEEAGDGLHVVASWPGGMWGQCWPQLEWRRQPGDDPAAILIYEAVTWFRFLAADVRRDEDVRALALSWAALPAVQQEQDRTVLHRWARAALYDHAVRAGWRKLDVQQRCRIGLSADSAAWQREEKIAYLRDRADMRTTSGVGQHSLTAASGRVSIHMPYGLCPVCEELSKDCRCG